MPKSLRQPSVMLKPMLNSNSRCVMTLTLGLVPSLLVSLQLPDYSVVAVNLQHKAQYRQPVLLPRRFLKWVAVLINLPCGVHLLSFRHQFLADVTYTNG